MRISDWSSDVCSSDLEDADREGALALREPVGDGADAGGEIARFADAEAEPRHRELGDGAGETVRHVADRPDQNRDRVAEPRADSIDDPAETDVAERVGDLEPADDRGQIDPGPAEFFLPCRTSADARPAGKAGVR